MHEIPDGTVTFLFTDIQNSTRLWQEYPEAMRQAQVRQEMLLRDAAAAYRGYVYKIMGDGVSIAFASPLDALRTALKGQQMLAEEVWDGLPALKVRMAIHTGLAQFRIDDYIGLTLNRNARMLSIGHGGQILLSQPVYAFVRDELTPEVTLRDMGSHRLKDLEYPEHVYQVLHPTLTVNFPPLKSLNAFPHNLPTQLTTFIGRERELREILALLQDPATRLLTLLGPGGIGKTRLSLAVAAQSLTEFPDGVWFVECEEVREAEGVALAICQTLHIQLASNQQPMERLCEALAERQLLLVCDNFEQVAGGGMVIGQLLRRIPRVSCLVTSRHALQVRGERVYLVTPMTVPPDNANPQDLLRFDSGQLFLARANDAWSAWSVSAETAPISRPFAIGWKARRSASNWWRHASVR